MNSYFFSQQGYAVFGCTPSIKEGIIYYYVNDNVYPEERQLLPQRYMGGEVRNGRGHGTDRYQLPCSAPSDGKSYACQFLEFKTIEANQLIEITGQKLPSNVDQKFLCDVALAFKEISKKYADGRHESKLIELISSCRNLKTRDEFIKQIDSLTAPRFIGGIGYGRLNAALSELSRQLTSEKELNIEYLGRLAQDKNAQEDQKKPQAQLK